MFTLSKHIKLVWRQWWQVWAIWNVGLPVCHQVVAVLDNLCDSWVTLSSWEMDITCRKEKMFPCAYYLLIGRFTVTSHAESRGRLRRLVGRREKFAAIYVVFTFYSNANKQLWWCRVLLWCLLVDVWIVRCHFTAFPRKRNDDNFGWMRSSANIGLHLRPTMTEFVDGISFEVLNRFNY